MNEHERLEALVAAQAAELEELRADKVRLEKAAMTDALTGLWNRRYARHELAALLSQGRRAAECESDDRRKDPPPYSVLMLDLDHFKRVNDLYGHDVGDAVLCTIASVMQQTCRESDTLVRWGGEEFLVLCHNTSQREALDLAHRLRKTIEEAHVGREWDVTWTMTASIGVSQPSSLDENYEVVIKRADLALYAAKGAGRNAVGQLYAETAA